MEKGERGTGNGELDESLKADAKFFFKRSEIWRNVFDTSIGLVRGKDAKGNWREPYDPYALGHGAGKDNVVAIAECRWNEAISRHRWR